MRILKYMALAVMLTPFAATAGNYPDKPITLICPYSAGGGGDTATRMIAKLAGDMMGVKINVENKMATSMTSNNRTINSDVIIGSADYHHIENTLLDENLRNYTTEYWEKRTFSPSSLIFYIGVNKKIDKLIHHNLFFDEDIEKHTNDIYDKPVWPNKPLFYACCPSKTDKSLAPIGKENLFLLMPIAPGLEDSEEIREKYFDIMIKRLEDYTEQEIEKHIMM